LKYGNIEII